mmetsp:Transcript_36634/g.114371  ORF Transcript_36634/g.114371 Transcript_36634/m.114371 type:complete len:229 (-) Transcript_36634:2007-2693(-)
MALDDIVLPGSRSGHRPVQLITPVPGLVVKTKDVKGKKIFINLVMHDIVKMPVDVNMCEVAREHIAERGLSNLRVPLDVSDPRDTEDKRGDKVRLLGSDKELLWWVNCCRPRPSTSCSTPSSWTGPCTGKGRLRSLFKLCCLTPAPPPRSSPPRPPPPTYYYSPSLSFPPSLAIFWLSPPASRSFVCFSFVFALLCLAVCSRSSRGFLLASTSSRSLPHWQSRMLRMC